MKENLRGLFYIVRGSYVKGKTPRFYNEVCEHDNFIGGYDPSDDTNEDWYMVLDNETFQCHGAKSSLKGALNIIRRIIIKYKTKEEFFNTLRGLDRPYSPIQVRLDKEVYNTYGNYFKNSVEGVEDEAYKELRNNNPVFKARNKKKRPIIKVEMEKVQKEITPIDTSDTNVPKKRNKGLKPIKRRSLVEIQ